MTKKGACFSGKRGFFQEEKFFASKKGNAKRNKNSNTSDKGEN